MCIVEKVTALNEEAIRLVRTGREAAVHGVGTQQAEGD